MKKYLLAIPALLLVSSCQTFNGETFTNDFDKFVTEVSDHQEMTGYSQNDWNKVNKKYKKLTKKGTDHIKDLTPSQAATFAKSQVKYGKTFVDFQKSRVSTAIGTAKEIYDDIKK